MTQRSNNSNTFIIHNLHAGSSKGWNVEIQIIIIEIRLMAIR